MHRSRRLNPYPVDPRYAGIYAHGVASEGPARTVRVSGQIGIAPNGALATGFEPQCRQAIENVLRVLADASAAAEDIVKMTFFLTRREDMDSLVAVRRQLLAGVSPAITTVFVAGLVHPDWLIEVEATAVVSLQASGHG